MRDVTFHSAALSRDMPYRVVLPANIAPGQKLPVVYLLHGGGGGFRDWTNDSDVARFAERGWIFVMPEGDSSYYVNSAGRPQDRYEDYIVKDLIADLEGRFPATVGKSNRAIMGISMGGFGAVNLSLRRPDLFVFAGALSPAIDVPSRPFSVKRIGQWREHSSPRCSASIIFDISTILDREATIGINGIRGCPAFFKACRNTSVARVAESFNRSSKPIPLY